MSMSRVTHRFVETNGIRMHIAEQGSGPLVVLLHGDVVGLLNALGEDQAVVAGHDWGAPIAWTTALLRPDRVRGVVGLSVPYMPRGPVSLLAAMRAALGDRFYISYFQDVGVADAELARDVRATLRRPLFSASGDVPGSGEP